MSNHSQTKASGSELKRTTFVENHENSVKELNRLLKKSILDKTSTTKNQVGNSYRVKEHHYMKSLYLHKLKNLQIAETLKKSSSQSVSGTEDKDKDSSQKSSNHYQPKVARSLCGGRMMEEIPPSRINFNQSMALSRLNNP